MGGREIEWNRKEEGEKEGGGGAFEGSTGREWRKQEDGHRLTPAVSCQSFIILLFLMQKSASGCRGDRGWGPGFFQG